MSLPRSKPLISKRDWTKRNETPGSKKKGEFIDVKSDGKPFKGIAKEPDKRRAAKDTGKGEASPRGKRLWFKHYRDKEALVT